jgi:DHA2 family multidrug resistance protein
MVSVLAPTLGPTLGGWLTDAFGWRSIFYINIIPGIAIMIAALALIRVDKPNFAMLKRIDYAHLASMAIFLGALEYVLEEGPRYDWFNDPGIVTAAWISFMSFLLFLERSFNSNGPIVKLTPFRNPTFVFACIFNLVIGFGLYASTYLVPVFLGRVRDYNSLQIGTTVFVTGIAQILSVVVAVKLSQRFDSRWIITLGLMLFAASLWFTSDITSEWGFTEFLLPQALRGFAILLCIVPSVNLALSGFEMAELRYASGLFNLMRNLGGAIGIAVVNTWLQNYSRIESLKFGESLGASGSHASMFVSQLAGHLSHYTADAQHALLMAQAQFAQVIHREALTQAFAEVFRHMSWIFVIALVMVPFCRTAPNKENAAPVDAH